MRYTYICDVYLNLCLVETISYAKNRQSVVLHLV